MCVRARNLPSSAGSSVVQASRAAPPRNDKDVGPCDRHDPFPSPFANSYYRHQGEKTKRSQSFNGPKHARELKCLFGKSLRK